DVLGRDAYGRVTSTATPGAGSELINTGIVFTPLAVATTDDKGHTTTQHYTLRGDLADVVDAAGTTTQYSYDAFGNNRRIEVNGNSATRVEGIYDLRGRKRSSTDPDMGAWTYEYNGFGELEWQRDAKL